MIRKFVFSDWETLDKNEFSKAENIDFLYDDEWVKYTLENKAIICFKNQGDNEWAMLLLVGNNFTSFDGKQIKRFMFKCVSELKAKRVWTISRQDELIIKWHKFLGMTIEKQVEHENITYDLWGITWE